MNDIMYIDTWRKIFLTTRTVAALTIDGKETDTPFCYVCEDANREPEKGYSGNWRDEDVAAWKIPAVTCIPSGEYEVTLEDSPKFGTETITLTDPALRQKFGAGAVPGFRYIRCHPGNTENDTEGCQVPGFRLTSNCTIEPGTSTPAHAALKAKIKAALVSGKTVRWRIHNCYNPDLQ